MVPSLKKAGIGRLPHRLMTHRCKLSNKE